MRTVLSVEWSSTIMMRVVSVRVLLRLVRHSVRMVMALYVGMMRVSLGFEAVRLIGPGCWDSLLFMVLLSLVVGYES